MEKIHFSSCTITLVMVQMLLQIETPQNIWVRPLDNSFYFYSEPYPLGKKSWIRLMTLNLKLTNLFTYIIYNLIYLDGLGKNSNLNSKSCSRTYKTDRKEPAPSLHSRSWIESNRLIFKESTTKKKLVNEII